MKKINYFILNLIYPKPKNIIKINKKEEKKIKIKKYSYKIYEIKNARLYTDTIHNFGIIKNDNLVEGPSYQIINNNFSNIKNNIILKIGTPRKKFSLNKKSVLSLLSGGGANKNYFHWLFDVLPRLAIIEKYINLKKIDFFLFPDVSLPFQIQTINLLKLKMKSLSSIKFRHLSADKIFSTSHPYVFTNNSHLDAQKIPKWISSWLKRKFLKHSSNKYNFKKIYIDRRSKYGRAIINNNEVKNFLEKKGFKSLFLEDYSFKDQISIFNNAKLIVGLHGAGFANLVFCKKNTIVLDLTSKTAGNQIKNLAKNNELKYSKLIGLTKQKTKLQQGIIKIPLKKLKKKLNII